VLLNVYIWCNCFGHAGMECHLLWLIVFGQDSGGSFCCFHFGLGLLVRYGAFGGKKCEEMAWSVKNFYLFPQTYYYFSSKLLLPPVSLLKHRIGHVRAFMIIN
jgi:hypothetical protein